MNILVFGGNGFIGSHVAERLLDSGHRLTLVSRTDSFPWNTVETIRPRIVRHIRCDRYNPSQCDDDLWNELDRASEFDAVIDFSAYRLTAVEPFYERLSTKSLAGNRPIYIYISTDSVYEVCSRLVEDRLLKETDSIRPMDEEERVRLAKGDSYGDRKLQIEEYLIDQRKNHNGLPFTILRLPDVLGERDSTERWWRYQLWLRYGYIVNRPVQVPTFASSFSTSFVDVKDVGAIIESVLNHRQKSEDQIFNVGFEKPFTLFELLSEMKIASVAPDEPISIQSEGEEVVSYFPSVTRGGMDVSKAKTELGWSPALEFSVSVRRIARFYLEAEKKYEKELMETVHSLMQDLKLNDGGRKRFLNALRNDTSSGAKKRKLTDEF